MTPSLRPSRAAPRGRPRSPGVVSVASGLASGLAPLAVLAALLGLAPSPAAAAPRAGYATPADLEPEGIAHVLDVAVLGAYAHLADPDRVGGAADLGGLALRNRLLVGRRIAYCAGLDGELGASGEGVVYGLTGYLAGLGLRLGAAGAIALCGGAGLDGAAGAVPFAARFPLELSIAVDAGPLRVMPWARAAWIAGEQAREGGVSWWSAVDEVEAGLLVRLSPQHRYWTTTSAGGGLALGVVYRELMDTSSIGLVVGLDLTGAQ